jgi:hypothetical protein
MKPETTETTPPLAKADLDRRKKVEQLIAKQGVAQTATFEHLLGTAKDLWDDDLDFKRFLDGVNSVRKEKG